MERDGLCSLCMRFPPFRFAPILFIFSLFLIDTEEVFLPQQRPASRFSLSTSAPFSPLRSSGVSELSSSPPSAPLVPWLSSLSASFLSSCAARRRSPFRSSAFAAAEPGDRCFGRNKENWRMRVHPSSSLCFTSVSPSSARAPVTSRCFSSLPTKALKPSVSFIRVSRFRSSSALLRPPSLPLSSARCSSLAGHSAEVDRRMPSAVSVSSSPTTPSLLRAFSCLSSLPPAMPEETPKREEAAPSVAEVAEAPVSKKAQKKAEKEAAKEAAKAAKREALEAEQRAAQAVMNKQVEDLEKDAFGYLPVIDSRMRTNREWIPVDQLRNHVGKTVWVRGRIQESRGKGSVGFLMLRERQETVQGVLDAKRGNTKDMIKWTMSLPLESVVDLQGTVVEPEVEIQSTSQKGVELLVTKIFCVSKAAQELPFQLRDAMRPEDGSEGGIRVNMDTRLDNRILDLRTPVNQAIFRIQSETLQLFREFLLSRNFVELHSPKLIGGASEGGASCFTLKYFNRDACLAQSPQLYKQMAMCADFERVFEIGPVFRAENSNTHRHLCEFTGLDLEMTFKEHYSEVLDLLDDLFKFIFKGLSERCKKEIDLFHQQHPAEPFTWIEETPRLSFEEGVQMLREAGCPNIPEDLSEFDLSTEQEKMLGRLVKEKYHTDFYMLLQYPLKVRPFYTMPDPHNKMYSNSYDFFMRNEEITSGAQRVHDADLLTQRCLECGVPPSSIQTYIDSFRLGTAPHGGAGIGLERVVMLFLGAKNIRQVSLFPRDPKRLTP
ncbi:aspartate-tRNA ligase [Toxoplasma gondii TgCatPRC2]|uniref:aspartate--tRNA ligase n=2 Tax=Toxoplasma gondii TaxID=5811 RepID=A0A151HB10_TOXGO|nr:aspartate-tRNA ligase [Toxoplasma gondii ARI]KYK66528.1 aspartate-tRNA ligase [Toxoplasma gondii TgCatPRC2]